MKHLLAPSVLACDFQHIHKAIHLIENSKADWYHIDVMDGVFVPNISFGFPVLEAIQKSAKKQLDVHLMIIEPERYIEKFINCGADVITVHYEATNHLHRTLQQIKDLGAKAGVALNPHTPVSVLSAIIHDVDMVCLMSVNPGFGGQKFIEHTLLKIKELKQMIVERGCETLIEIDGGVNANNAEAILAAGADVLVAGSSVFKADNPEEAINFFKSL
ncbi:UNVERIFIED_CONTAM: hypothetical protein GTU68_004985 [Idotea baltica]|nr:hypothetical protein [Idotea baltica]